MGRRLSASERAALEGRREQRQLELKLIVAELRSDEALRLQEAERVAGERAEDRLRFAGRRVASISRLVLGRELINSK